MLATLILLASVSLGPPAADSRIEAYCDALSVAPGEIVRFHVSTNQPTYAVEIQRVGATRDVVWSKDGFVGQDLPVPHDVSARGCRWPAGVVLPATTLSN